MSPRPARRRRAPPRGATGPAWAGTPRPAPAAKTPPRPAVAAVAAAVAAPAPPAPAPAAPRPPAAAPKCLDAAAVTQTLGVLRDSIYPDQRAKAAEILGTCDAGTN